MTTPIELSDLSLTVSPSRMARRGPEFVTRKVTDAAARVNGQEISLTDFRRAYAEDGLSPAEFEHFGPGARTLSEL